MVDGENHAVFYVVFSISAFFFFFFSILLVLIFNVLNMTIQEAALALQHPGFSIIDSKTKKSLHALNSQEA
jgi:hypothetical protein